MSNLVQREDRLFDPVTGSMAGYIDANGKEKLLSADALQAIVSGARTTVAASRAITAADNGALLAPAAGVVLTIPAGLSPAPSFTVACPATGTVTIAVSGGATINGAATSLARTRAANPAAFVVFAHAETDVYGVTGA